MPTCIGCGADKPDAEFSWRWKDDGIRQKKCKDCRARENALWYERHHDTHRENVSLRMKDLRASARQFVFEYLSENPCRECGESDPVVLEFHHIGDKEETVSRLVTQGASVERIEREIRACIVLCANCHRKLTARERGWFRGQ